LKGVGLRTLRTTELCAAFDRIRPQQFPDPALARDLVSAAVPRKYGVAPRRAVESVVMEPLRTSC
jgi:hypothetical protein